MRSVTLTVELEDGSVIERQCSCGCVRFVVLEDELEGYYECVNCHRIPELDVDMPVSNDELDWMSRMEQKRVYRTTVVA